MSIIIFGIVTSSICVMCILAYIIATVSWVNMNFKEGNDKIWTKAKMQKLQRIIIKNILNIALMVAVFILAYYIYTKTATVSISKITMIIYKVILRITEVVIVIFTLNRGLIGTRLISETIHKSFISIKRIYSKGV